MQKEYYGLSSAELDAFRVFMNCGTHCERLCAELGDILRQTPQVLSNAAEADASDSPTKGKAARDKPPGNSNWKIL